MIKRYEAVVASMSLDELGLSVEESIDISSDIPCRGVGNISINFRERIAERISKKNVLGDTPSGCLTE